MKFQENAKVLSIERAAPHHYKISLYSPLIAKTARPGQFIMIKCENESNDPLLRRPISIHSIGKESIEILFRVTGKGTGILSQQKKDEVLNIIGPLGKEFTVNPNTQVAILIGGGAGIAPMLALAEQLKNKIKAVYVIIGANTYEEVLCEKEFKGLGVEVAVSTDDGSYGKKGNVIDVLVELIGSKLTASYTQIFACGPKPMYKALRTISMEYKVPCQVSLEEWMACGIGSCNGCTVETKDGYKKVCKDGPVFDIGDIIW